ncbi:MAG TPA: hypothetical protein VHS97_19720 [Isosphaeraceae bacterium]|nr:hypothetical protein [Isosphaeraceae bacterium]
MARPITLELPTCDPRAELRSRLQTAPAEHAEALLAAFEVLQGLHDRGVLDLMRGALGSSDKVLEIAVDVAKSPESIRSIRNMLLAVNLLSAIDPEELITLTQAVPQALKLMVRQPEPPGLWQLMRNFLWNQNIRRGLSALNVLLETFGGTLARKSGHE